MSAKPLHDLYCNPDSSLLTSMGIQNHTKPVSVLVNKKSSLHPWLKEYIDYKESQNETFSSHKLAATHFLKWLITQGPWVGMSVDTVPLKHLTPIILKNYNDFVYRLLRNGVYAQKTLSDYTYSLRIWLRWLEDKKGINGKIPNTLKIISPPEPEPRRFSRQMCQKILFSMDKIAPFDFVFATMFMLLTGCRSCELARMLIADLDLQLQTVLLRGKGGKYRTIPLPTEILEPLNYYLVQRQNYNSHIDKLFLKKTGTGYSESHFNVTFNKYLNEALLEMGYEGDVSGTHSFRHSFITELERSGVKLEDIMKITGIKKLETLQVYLDVNTKEVADELKSKFTLEG